MKIHDNAPLIFTLPCIFIAVVMFSMGFLSGRDVARETARKAGVGQWVTDETTGYKNFVYTGAKPNED